MDFEIILQELYQYCLNGFAQQNKMATRAKEEKKKLLKDISQANGLISK